MTFYDVLQNGVEGSGDIPGTTAAAASSGAGMTGSAARKGVGLATIVAGYFIAKWAGLLPRWAKII